MKKIITVTLLLAGMLLLAASCKKDDKESCKPNSSSFTTTQDMTVQYRAMQSGDGTISSLTYYTSATDVDTVNNPQLPWSVTVDVNAGSNLMISAEGTARNGQVGVSFEAVGQGEYVLQGDTCVKSHK